MEIMTSQLCFELLICEHWCLVANCCFKGFISILTVLQIETVKDFYKCGQHCEISAAAAVVILAAEQNLNNLNILDSVAMRCHNWF